MRDRYLKKQVNDTTNPCKMHKHTCMLTLLWGNLNLNNLLYGLCFQVIELICVFFQVSTTFFK